MIRYTAWLFQGLLLLGLVSCIPVNQRSGMPDLRDFSTHLGGVDWLEEVNTVLLMPASEHAASLRDRQHAYRVEANATTGMRLALMRALGGEDVRNEVSALALLDEIDPQTMGREQNALAGLLRRLLMEKQQANLQLRNERKVFAEREARIRELETQLEAVTSIEQSIKERQKAQQGVTP